MKNYEKYADEIKGYDGFNFCRDFVKPRILKPRGCANTNCDQCKMLQMLWLMEEYEEPKIDWNKIKIDTPVLVRDNENNEWRRFYFAKYENGLVYTWVAGATSWTAKGNMYKWRFAKLAESEDKCEKTNKEEPETDWSNVVIDTPILVRQGKTGDWLERHFAKYENGNVYAWVDGQTSWTGAGEIKWKYAKLAEVDWNKVEVDTLILVRDDEDGKWLKRYFAKYKDGKVYAWNGGRTGQIESYMTPWNFAKLAEDEETK